MSKPDNIIRFDSANSAFTGFTIEQRHAPDDSIHDHQEHDDTNDGWVSTVVENNSGVIRGPFAFTGDAVQAMKAWAIEKIAENQTSTTVEFQAEPTSDVEDEING